MTEADALTTAADELMRTLHMRAGFEVVNHSVNPTQLRFIGRVPKQHVSGWLIIARQMLLKSGGAWTIDVSKQYFLRAGKLMFGWRLIIQSPNGVGAAISDIIKTVVGAPRPRQMVTEQPLVGRVTNYKNFKGAAPSGTVAVGAAAVAQMPVKG